jgi:hypothetical protein
METEDVDIERGIEHFMAQLLYVHIHCKVVLKKKRTLIVP